ncbi:Ppx/GppA phosphatase family protein [Nitratireductor sp. ZSWI3]|uniref:Ppx/GppA phosphatase family protein n=1 Tax=Nitratireductor sp. ZSWI3 TaxID=2966359 RepID=UPI0021503AFB|nr:Ppx/GppA phosphatase family protein [Nitratireductor sp. ZSWI3]MCR4265104.1 Ppx/GppA family phosphatase [Nitratireductor sp. ZSWI3]
MDNHDDAGLRPAARGVRNAASEGGVTLGFDDRSAGPSAYAEEAAASSKGADAHPQKRKRRKRRRRRVYVKGPEGARSAASQAPGPEATPARQPSASRRPVPAGEEARATYAALDLGTNNCRLLMAVPSRPSHFQVVDAFSRIVRLGEGLSRDGRLGEAAMDRAVAALKICADKLDHRKPRRVRLIATEACRSAENGAAFIGRVKKETGLTLEIIDRRTEARLAVAGCSTLVERGTEGVVLFDIGGGSSEIALVDISRHRTPRLADHIVSWTSLPVGVVSLAERFGGHHVTRESFAAMVEAVSELLDRFDDGGRLNQIAAGGRFHLIGTSGTVTTLAGVHLGLTRYDRRRVDGLWMERDNVDRMIDTLLSWDFEQRKANPCIGADRADLVLGGCAILEAIRRRWPAERLRVADRGLREGMLSEMMAADGVWRRRRRMGRSA